MHLQGEGLTGKAQQKGDRQHPWQGRLSSACRRLAG